MIRLQEAWHERTITNAHTLKGAEWTIVTSAVVYDLQERISLARAALIRPDVLKNNASLNVSSQEGNGSYLTYLSAAEVGIIHQDVKSISHVLSEKAGLSTMRSKLTAGLMHTFNEGRYKQAHNALQLSYKRFLHAAADSDQNKEAVYLHRNQWDPFF